MHEKEEDAEKTDVVESEVIVPGEVVKEHHQNSDTAEKVEIGRCTSTCTVRHTTYDESVGEEDSLLVCGIIALPAVRVPQREKRIVCSGSSSR
jgi:hypothetical protein